MRILSWLLRAFIFFTLFAFALNNQHTASVHWFFGVEWRAPMVFVVLAAFVAGCALGAAAMLPGWWTSRQNAAPAGPTNSNAAAAALPAAAAGPGTSKQVSTSSASISDFGADHPSRQGL